MGKITVEKGKMLKVYFFSVPQQCIRSFSALLTCFFVFFRISFVYFKTKEAALPRGEPYVFGNGRASRMGAAFKLIQK